MDRCFPRTRRSSSSPARHTAPSGCLRIFRRTSRSRWKSRSRRPSTATTPARPCCTPMPAGTEWVEEHIHRLSAKGIQTHFQLANITQLETVERMMRRGACNVPLILTWVAIGGGFDAPNLYNLANFVRAVPDGAVLTLETSMLNVLPINTMAIALGLHVRCGIEDNIWTQDRSRKMTSVEQVEQ